MRKKYGTDEKDDENELSPDFGDPSELYAPHD